MAARRATIKSQLLASLDEGFERGWHGPTLWGALRGVTPACASWRPSPGRHNIWELAVHAAYWKYVTLKRITGAQPARFPLRGSNFFVRPDPASAPSPSAWADDLANLKVQHDRLRTTVEQMPETALTAKNARGRDRVDVTVRGIAAHDVYHTGQIQLLKHLWQAGRSIAPR